MQFDSLLFIVFLVLVIACYYAISSWRERKIVLLVASYLFYAAWSPPLVILVWISTLTDYVLARRMGRTTGEAARKRLLIVSLMVNLGILGYFKYAGFLLQSFADLMLQVGLVYQAPALDIILPIGISFYTFQTLSYTIDVYRRELRPDHGLLDFSLYVTFFPQLVAGPIVRASYFLPQCDSKPHFRGDQFSWGLILLLFGLFAKVVLADTAMAPVSDYVFSSVQQLSTLDAWTGVMAFSGQIFFDFSGYSLCALGTAMMLGFSLPDNFRSPYASVGFSDFWQRWHISLSSWLRDYLYIPLGGNRSGRLRAASNVMFTMLLGGLWHGASWNFVIWGGLHGLYLGLERVIRARFPAGPSNRALMVLIGLATFVVVSVTWIPFRAGSLSDSVIFFQQLFHYTPGTRLATGDMWIVFVVTAAMLLWHAHARESSLEARFSAISPALRVAVVAAMLLMLGLSSSGDSRAFIYFQF